MQQAPEYREQEPLHQEPVRSQEPVRREYISQQPTPAYQGQPTSDAAVASSRQAGPLSWSDWVRWGPIWSGFFTIVATLLVLGALGAAISLSVWHTAGNTAFGYGWSILTGIVAYFLGGWVAARSAGVNGTGPALLNAGLTWALSLVAIVVVAIFGAGSAFGILGGNLSMLLRGGPGMTVDTLTQTAWISFASLVIGLIVAMIGGLVGARNFRGLRTNQQVNRRAL